MDSDDRGLNLQQMWQQQLPRGVQLSKEELTRKTSRLQRRVRWRNARECAGAVLAFVIFGWAAIHSATWWAMAMRGVAAVVPLGVAWYLYRNGSVRLSEDELASASSSFYRRELERQSRLLHGVLRWYVAPLMIPILLVLATVVAERPAARTAAGLMLPVILGFCFFVWKLNHRAAQAIDRQIEILREWEGESHPHEPV